MTMKTTAAPASCGLLIRNMPPPLGRRSCPWRRISSRTAYSKTLTVMDDRASVHARREPGSDPSRMAFVQKATAGAEGCDPDTPSHSRVDTRKAGPESAAQRHHGESTSAPAGGQDGHRHRGRLGHRPGPRAYL